MFNFSKLALLCSTLGLFGNFAGCCKKETECSTKSASKKEGKKTGKKAGAPKKAGAKKKPAAKKNQESVK
jgi:hypothetical protein